jgi:D-alanyl-D-alanine carboxypeptidase (penicillin-binding protein 5/6)
MKKIFLITALLAFLASSLPAFANTAPSINVDAKSGILMEPVTGKILFESNADERLAPASVTKVMTILLIYEAFADGKFGWDDVVTTSEYAAGMGGSQIFLEPFEKQTARDLTKSIVIASANDASVAMAEFISGSEEAFVGLMNKKAADLGATNTNFVNSCGLDAPGHYTSVRQDLAGFDYTQNPARRGRIRINKY